MLLLVFEWLSTLFFFIGALHYTGTKASKPKTRINGFIFHAIGGIIFIILNLMYGLYAFATAQILFVITDILGIKNCLEELKNG